MKLAFVYAGQGSQYVGMGKDFYENYPAFRETFALAEKDLAHLSFEASAEELAQTANTQPAMVAFAVGVTDLLYEAGIRPMMAAGLSLGEYSALYAAGVFDKKTVIDLADYRGKVMQECLTKPCEMQAILGLDRETLAEIVKEASAYGLVEIANYNCPGQLAIAGEEQSVQMAGKLALERGAKRAVKLKVSGPFHTSMMKPAGDLLREKFETVDFQPLNIPVIFNTTAKPLEMGKSIAQMLELQVQASVYFEDSIRYMLEQGIDTIVEIGPGKVLSGFIKRIDKTVKAYVVEDIPSLEKVIAELKGVSHGE